MVMKKMLLTVSLLLAGIVVQAQDCEALVLPCFNNDRNALANYPAEKLLYRCLLAQSAFYESDTIPAGAEVMDISNVVEYATGKKLSSNIVIDLNTFSFYAYNFAEIQVRHNSVTERTCFATPRSKHPYLVLRSANEMRDAAEKYLNSVIDRQ